MHGDGFGSVGPSGATPRANYNEYSDGVLGAERWE